MQNGCFHGYGRSGSHRIDDHKSIFIIMPSYLFSNIHSHKGVVAAKMRDHFCGSSPDFKSFIDLLCICYSLSQLIPRFWWTLFVLICLLVIYSLKFGWSNLPLLFPRSLKDSKIKQNRRQADVPICFWQRFYLWIEWFSRSQ